MENYLNFMWPFGSMNSNVSMGGIDQTNAANNMKANTNYPAITGLPHSGFEEMDRQPPGIEQSNVAQTQKKGFNFPGIFSLMRNMFQRPEAKQKEFETYQQSKGPEGWGDIGGGYEANLWGNNKINVADPASGEMILRDKNFDSAFGSDSVAEMIAKKDAWIADRLLSGKGLSKALTRYAMEKGLGTFGGDKPAEGPTITGGPTPRDTSGWSSPGYTTRGGFTGTRGSQHGGAGTGQRGHHGNFSQGGRVGYNRGGRVGILAAF